MFQKGLTLNAPYDKWGAQVAKILITPGAARDRLTAGAYIPRDEERRDRPPGVRHGGGDQGRPDRGAGCARRMKEGKLPQRTLAERRASARCSRSIVTQEEYDHLVLHGPPAARASIKVDDFEHGSLARDEAREDTWQADSRKKAAVASL